MSSINSVGGSSYIQQAYAKQSPAKASDTSSTTPTRGTDKLELSTVNHMLGQLKTNDVRMDKVSDIKAQIAAGTYDVDGKLDATADKMLDDVLA